MSIVGEVLRALRQAADAVAFPETRWVQTPGAPGETSRPLTLKQPGGHFEKLKLQPGVETRVVGEIEVGKELADEPLEATLFSLYPVDVRVGGKSVFAEDGVPVAAGPALFEVLPRLKPGQKAAVELRVRVPQQQVNNWFNFRLTTPSLRARFERLDVAWARLAVADAVASTAPERAAVEKAAEMARAALAGKKLRDGLDKMAKALEPLAAKVGKLRVHLIGHAHIDMNWLWTWPDTLEVIKRDYRSVLSLMREFPELTFSHSQPAEAAALRQVEPEMVKEVRKRIAEGRWEPLTMAWLEGDVNMASGEAHVRQLLEGVKFSEEALGIKPTSYHAPDTFGHAGNLPQLVKSAGGQRYYHHRGNPGQTTQSGDQWPAYWWEGDDGSRVLAYSTYSYNGEIRARDIAAAAIRAHRWGLPCGLHFHGVGDHGGGPARQNLQALRRFRQTKGLPEAFCSRVDAYTREVLDSGVRLPVHKGESSTIFEGCYTTHADTKLYNREGENLLVTADTLAAMAGIDATKKLEPAWRAVLFNQFHDLLDGSAIHEAYEMNAADFAAVESAATGVMAAALTKLEGGLKAGTIAVTNPLGHAREDVVVVPGIKGKGTVRLRGGEHETVGQFTEEGLVFVAKVPDFGTVGYEIKKSEAKSQKSEEVKAVGAYSVNDEGRSGFLHETAEGAPYLLVETRHFRAYVRKDCGILCSFFDKRAGRELVAYGLRRGSDYLDSARVDLGLNVLQLLDEHPHGMSSWHMDEVWRQESLLRGATTQVVETGPVRCVLEVTHKVRQSTIRQHILFYRDLPRVDFKAWIDWQELGSDEAGVPNLKVAFTGRLNECEAWYETPFAAARRPADGQEVPALRWADIGGRDYGFALVNASKYGYDALGCRLRLSLVRSGYAPDAISDVGMHEVAYSFVPHVGDWRQARVVETAAGFNLPLVARKVTAQAKPAARFTPRLEGHAGAVVACLKTARDGRGRIVRVYESTGRSGTLRISGLGSRVWQTNVIEEDQRELPVSGGGVELSLRPWEVVSLRVEG